MYRDANTQIGPEYAVPVALTLAEQSGAWGGTYDRGFTGGESPKTAYDCDYVAIVGGRLRVGVPTSGLGTYGSEHAYGDSIPAFVTDSGGFLVPDTNSNPEPDPPETGGA